MPCVRADAWPHDQAGAPPAGGDTTLTVFAASSLTATFEQLADDFEAAHDGVDVQISFGGSSDLVAQIQSGAPADVFASADTANMDKLVADGLVDGDPVGLRGQHPRDRRPAGQPGRHHVVRRPRPRPASTWSSAPPRCPAARPRRRCAEAAGVTLAPVSEEQTVTDVLTKVELRRGRRRPGLRDRRQAAGDDVEGITFPESRRVVNTYPIAVVDGSDAGRPRPRVRRPGPGRARASRCCATRGSPRRRSRPRTVGHPWPEHATPPGSAYPAGSTCPRWSASAFVLLPLAAIVARVDWAHFGALVTSRVLARRARR